MRPEPAYFLTVLIAISGCAHGPPDPRPPGPEDAQGYEVGRVMTPLAMPTRNPRQIVIEFAPEVETRNVACTPLGRTHVCRFESRTTGFAAPPVDVWERREIVFVRKPFGGWRAATNRLLAGDQTP